MKPIYDTEQYNNFMSYIKTIGYHKIKYDIGKIKNELVNYLKSNTLLFYCMNLYNYVLFYIKMYYFVSFSYNYMALKDRKYGFHTRL